MISQSGDFVSRFNLSAMEATYEQWRQDPNSVDEHWNAFFAGFELGMEEPLAPAKDPGARMQRLPLVLPSALAFPGALASN